MAFMSQERKSQIAPVVKAICKKYGVKASLSVHNHSTLVLNVTQGNIDFIENFIETDKNKSYAKYMSQDQIDHLRKSRSLDVNPYHFKDHFTGRALQFIKEVHTAMMKGNHDNSDIQSDYFDVGWYVDINIGRWNKPYALVK